VVDDSAAKHAVDALALAMSFGSGRALPDTQPAWQDAWLIAAWHAMYGDTTLARRWYAQLGTLPAADSPRDYAAALRDDLDSRLAARRGDLNAALRYARRAFSLWYDHTYNQRELGPEPAMRFHLAALLRATQRTDSAAALFRSLVPPATWLGFYTARAALELGEIAADHGDRRTAERELLRALRLWERGDSVVAPLRERARARLGGRERS
jgi:hypothetical protein